MRVRFLQLDLLDEDPSGLEDGMEWYNNTEKQHKRYVDGSVEVIADMGDVGGSTNLDGGKADTNFGGIAPIDGGSA
jgi:hypothetical protein